MFTWICPQCGAEVPPSYADCPRCADRLKATQHPAAAPPPPQPPPPPQGHPQYPPVAAPPPPQAPPPPLQMAPQQAPPPGPPPQYAQAPYPPQQYPPPYPHEQYAQQPYPPQPYPPQYAQPQYPPPPQQYPPQYAPPPVRTGPPGWLVTLGVMVVVLGLGWLLYGFLGKRDAARVATPAAPAPAAETSEPAVKGAEGREQVNIAKSLELTGVRIVEEKKKAWVRVMVINHSASDIAEVKGTITVLTKDGQKTVGSIPVTIPDLLSFEAKEVTGPLNTSMRAYEVPDWQFLRAEIDLKKR